MEVATLRRHAAMEPVASIEPQHISDDPLSVEIARQRALQAAEYYHSTILSKPSPSDSLESSPGSPDPGYKAKLRAGFIDLRNTYRRRGDGRQLYRSNSSLELAEEETAVRLRREYGSANSLDMLSTNEPSKVLDMLQQGYHHIDHEALNRAGNASVIPQASPKDVTPGAIGGEFSGEKGKANLSNGDDSSQSSVQPIVKKNSRKSRKQSIVSEGTGLLRRLRGAKSTPQDSDAEAESKQRRKAIVVYDCQSLGFSLSEVISRRAASRDVNSVNTATGASAASHSQQDTGDGCSNDLLLRCSNFRSELGGEELLCIELNRTTAQRRVQQLLGNRVLEVSNFVLSPACNGVAVLERSPTPHGAADPALLIHDGLVIEHVDHGAFYYRNFFSSFEHHSLMGIDEVIGPVVISLRRVRSESHSSLESHANSDGSPVSSGEQSGSGSRFSWRIIVRTAELTALRALIPEEAVPSSSRLSNARGIAVKDLLDFMCPELQLSCLKYGLTGDKTSEALVKLDEQALSHTYKIGVLLCREGQSTEEEMYNNEHSTPAFDEFIELLGNRVRLNGFEKYRGGLDCKTDSTGLHSLFRAYHNYELMFHVSTMLPFTSNNRQQLLRKRHIGNDIVTIIFQEPGALPFTPKSVRSQFQHVFIIVRVHNPCSESTKYSIAVTRCHDVPSFGPPIPSGALFNKGPEFSKFLLVKAINAENAAHKAEKFVTMAARTREEYLRDFVANFSSNQGLDTGSKLAKFGLGSGRRKDKLKPKIPDVHSKATLQWHVQVEDFGRSSTIDCLIGISYDTIVLLSCEKRQIIFTIPSKSVIGWTSAKTSLRIYFDHGECFALKPQPLEKYAGDLVEIVYRLEVTTQGCETREMTLKRNGMGQLGFHVHYEGVVSDVEPYGFAYQAGLRQGARLVEICKVCTATLTHEQMIDLLRTSLSVRVLVIPPLKDGNPRRGDSSLLTVVTSVTSPNNALTLLPDLCPLASDEDPTTLSVAPGQLFRSPSAFRSEVQLNGANSRSIGDMGTIPMSIAANHTFNSSSTANLDFSKAAYNTNSGAANLDFSKAAYNTNSGAANLDFSKAAYNTNSGAANLDFSTAAYNTNSGATNLDFSTMPFNSGPGKSGLTPLPMDLRSRPDKSGERHVESDSEWAGRVRIYPAYGAQQEMNSIKARWGSEDPWVRRRPLQETASVSSLSIQSDSPSLHHHIRQAHLHAPGPAQPHNDHLSDHIADTNSSSRAPLSPLGLRHHSGFLNSGTNSRPLHVPSASPHSSKSESPPSNHRLLPHDRLLEQASAQQLHHQQTTHNSPKHAPPPSPNPSARSGGLPLSSKSLPPDTFQEELIRLIDPDVSLTDLESTLETEEANRQADRLKRARSEDSMRRVAGACGTGALIGREQRLSPRAISRAAGATDQATVPLAEPSTSLDWGNLVNTASKAFSSSADHRSEDGLKSPSRPLRPVRADCLRPAHEKQCMHRLQEDLEKLQLQLVKERDDRVALESQVNHLRQDNERLQDESQTAATQLRKFTEWFFSTIERH